MLDFAWSEFIVLAIVALIFLGPKELIILFRTLGRWASKARALQATFTDHLNAAASEIDNDTKSR